MNTTKKISIFLLVIIQSFLISCQDELLSPLSDIKISDSLLSGYFVTSIAFDSKGTAWIGTFKQGLIRYDGLVNHFDSTNSSLPDSIIIWSVDIDKSDNIWIGSNKGLIKFDRKTFIIYNKSNAPLLTDNVFALAVDANNILWFTSCVFGEGGVMKYDGINWTLFSPQNSKLPGSLISDIIVDIQNNIWVTINEGVNSGSIVKITGDNLKVYGKEAIGIDPYYFGNLANGFNNQIYAAIDYMFSSAFDINRPNIIEYNGSSWKVNNPVDENGKSLGYVGKITVDLMGNLWASTSQSGIAVYNGQKWIYKKSELIIKNSVFDMTVDKYNRIWIGSGNGIYIVN
jgi:ligand-binding sensor domain-containing protein